jgi:tRNA threonylcarbamoyl adenosine modification protein YeaZ
VLVLAIDTSSPAVVAGVVYMDGEPRVLAERSPVGARGHGELLSPAIADCLREADVAASDIGAVVAGAGPGPFTGLRVGLVTAAAFADAVDAPTYAVCSLDAIAAGARDQRRLLVATDARRREVYWATYNTGRRITDPAVDRPDAVPVTGISAVAGTGGDLYPDAWPGVPRLPVTHPALKHLVSGAWERLATGAPSEKLVPMYLRRPDAVEPGAPKPVGR